MTHPPPPRKEGFLGKVSWGSRQEVGNVLGQVNRLSWFLKGFFSAREQLGDKFSKVGWLVQGWADQAQGAGAAAALRIPEWRGLGKGLTAP